MIVTRWLLTLLLLLDVAGCTWLKPRRIAECEKKRANGKADACYSEAAVNRAEAEWCAHVTGVERQSTCYGTVGEHLLRDDLCIKAQLAETKDRCLASIARNTAKIPICERIATMDIREDCISNIAEDTDNFETCAKISTVSKRESCQLGRARGPSAATLCGRIATEETRDACFALMLDNGEPFDAVYDRISRAAGKETLILRTATDDPGRCGRLPNEARPGCYGHVFFQLKDPAKCAKISDLGQQDECRAQLGGRRREEMLCEQVKDASLRDDCLLQVAGRDDPDACFRIRAEEKSRRCAQSTIAYATDKRICTLIPPMSRKECFEKMAAAGYK